MREGESSSATPSRRAATSPSKSSRSDAFKGSEDAVKDRCRLSLTSALVWPVPYSPKRTRLESDERPTFHPSSNWPRSGEDSGTWFTFPEPGCWELHASRDGSSGDLWVEVK
jgi:hypothetical protein